MGKFKVMRMCEKEICDIQIGDKILIPLAGFGEFAATAEKVEDSKVLFIFDRIVARRAMNRTATNIGGFKNTELYHWLQKELLPKFPEELKSHIRELTIPTIGETVGHESSWINEYYEPDEDEQLPLMKDLFHQRSVFIETHVSYWLRNASKNTTQPASCFAVMYGYGVVGHCVASDIHFGGVCPEFWLVR